MPAGFLVFAFGGGAGYGREGGGVRRLEEAPRGNMWGHVHAGLPSVQSSGGLMPGNGNYSPNESQEESPAGAQHERASRAGMARRTQPALPLAGPGESN